MTKGCSQLQRLSITSTNLGDLSSKAIASIADLHNLSLLYLKQQGIDDNGIRAIATRCPLLDNVYLNECRSISPAAFGVLGDRSGLKCLNLYKTRININSFFSIALKCRDLKSMGVEECMELPGELRRTFDTPEEIQALRKQLLLPEEIQYLRDKLLLEASLRSVPMCTMTFGK